ncbi:hypothetical protein ABIF20_002996 [Bradyrhizobium japonicum]
MTADDGLDEDGFRARNAFDGLPGHRLRKKADEVAGMPRLHGDADLAIGLEAADAGSMAGARIDHDEWTPTHVDLNILRRNDAHQRVVDRFVQLSAVRDQFSSILQHMRRGLGDVLAILVATLAHDVQE